jgi:hypothetical protein
MGRIVGSLFDDSGGSLVVTDLDVDSGTISVDETNNRVGLGTTAPGTQLQVESNAPYVTLKNDTSENTAGGCESKVIFEDHGNNALGQIEVSHVGSSDDEKGQLILKTNNDSGLQTALTISEAQAATFAGDVTVSGGDITYGNGQNATASVAATAHDTAGKNLTITSGATTAGTTNNIAGGSLTIQAGQGKGTGAGGDIVFQTANAGSSGSTLNSLATALTISDDKSATFTGPVIALSAMASSGPGNTFVTFADGDGTPSVATGNLFKHHASTETITMFDDGISGQIITVISTAAITYDVTGTNLKGGSADIVTANGDVTQWCFDGTNWYLLQFMDVSADHSTIGGGGGGADANDLDHILHQQVFGR